MPTGQWSCKGTGSDADDRSITISTTVSREIDPGELIEEYLQIVAAGLREQAAVLRLDDFRIEGLCVSKDPSATPTKP